MSSKKSIPRPEHPRPQLERAEWLNLNGQWTFEFDFGKSGLERGLAASTGFERAIMVPFCPESKLSGVQHTDFIEAMWYHRKVQIQDSWKGKRIILHFGAVDYEAEVFIDGNSLGCHFGGSASFEYEISDSLKDGGSHDLVLRVFDDVRSGAQPGGKQCPDFKSRGCHYTRTTGIWQTVWLEAVAPEGIRRCRIVPDFDAGAFVFTPSYYAASRGNKLKISVMEEGQLAGEATVQALDGLSVTVPLKSRRAWSPKDPFLYDIKLELIDSSGLVTDTVKSYAGLRKIHLEGDKIFLNNEPIYLRFVLDQGFYPDGIWTAPDDLALKHDIELSMRAGFNGARLHQKVFEERFHYWADKLGYLTWAESPSWGLNIWRCENPAALSAWNMLNEWRELVERDLNHPSIIAWTPLNETRDTANWKLHKRFHRDIYDLTKSLDPSRPVNEASGYVHVKTDLWTVHNYTQDPAKLREQLTPGEKGVWKNYPELEAPYQGQPYLVDEWGGIKWIPPQKQAFADNSWGYGEGPKSEEEFYSRLAGQMEAILSQAHICGHCYTQLTDVEQEQNGIYNYDRSEKFDMKRIASIFSKEPCQ